MILFFNNRGFTLEGESLDWNKEQKERDDYKAIKDAERAERKASLHDNTVDRLSRSSSLGGKRKRRQKR